MKNIVLIGFMGTGKTSTGHVLASQLGLSFIDIDQKVELESGMTITDMFHLYGEAYFRQKERNMIADVCRFTDSVIATGGGAVLAPENIANLKRNGIIIALTASIEVILERVGRNNNRPLVNLPEKENIVAKLIEERADCYNIADFTIDTTASSPEQSAQKIITLLQARGELDA